MDIECKHPPHVFRIIYDVGEKQTSTYRLCKTCQTIPDFQNYIIAKQEIKN